ncbi:hypothetical protein RHMOL_Rhmol09G0184600 [Rhododendron molle]|uniref:Uncharacterized protein n=1 Tax=Rhododendron molle TaxID=49168 RepID=A0ACC0MEZ9_RHOML|nr:hypothetical protein RHMOL_Rhmol09G0184600 [Rhododendron molle]
MGHRVMTTWATRFEPKPSSNSNSYKLGLRSSKEKPTLGGTRIKPRKRNIAAPLDPATFADAVVQIYLDNAGDLELVAKSLESSDLDFSRYGDTFFEARGCNALANGRRALLGQGGVCDGG